MIYTITRSKCGQQQCCNPYELPSKQIMKISLHMSTECLQCFDAVGWAAGRASGL